jgi:dihydroxyacetone kinase-like predicted kinase
VTEKEARGLSAWVTERYPDKEVELVEGRQPYYQYIISAE